MALVTPPAVIAVAFKLSSRSHSPGDIFFLFKTLMVCRLERKTIKLTTKIEKWECLVCHKDYPCKIEIQSDTDGLPEHLKDQECFKRKVCICNETRFPEWKRIENKES